MTTPTSWRCGGCGTWYAPHIDKCTCGTALQPLYVPIIPAWPQVPYYPGSPPGSPPWTVCESVGLRVPCGNFGEATCH